MLRTGSAVALVCFLAVALPEARPTDAAVEEGFVAIFNGKDLTGWKGLPEHWAVEDVAITGVNTKEKPLKKNTFLVWQGGKPGNFELRLKYKIVGGNSGVQYRSKVVDAKEFVVHGYHADIDSSPRFTGMNYEEGGRTFLAQRGERVMIGADGKKAMAKIGDKDELQKTIKAEDWNAYVIVAKGNSLKHFVNGRLMSEVTDDEKGKAAASGVIAIQLHAGPPMKVQLKDIRLMEVK